MVKKYDPLTEALRAAAARGQDTVEMSLRQVADLVGGLPASSERRQWWANSSQVQALAWGGTLRKPRPSRRKPVRRAVRLRRRWLDGGPVILDRDAKLTFRWVEEAPGLYRITLPGGLAGTPTRV
jgi:hypothetical protein